MSLAGAVKLAGGDSSVLFQGPEVSDDLANLFIGKLLSERHHDLLALVVDDTVLDRLGNGLIRYGRLCLGRRVVRHGEFLPHWSVSCARLAMALLAVLHVEFLSVCVGKHRKGKHSNEGEYKADFFAHAAEYADRQVKVKTLLESLEPKTKRAHETIA